MQKRFLIWFGTASIFAAFPAGAGSNTSTAMVGKPAPNFTLTMFDKSKKTLADYNSRVLVINYWATWCSPCKAEMPMMSAYHRRHVDEGFDIVGVITKDSIAPSKLKAVSAALSYPLATDLKGKYDVINDSVPSTYVIDRKGVIRLAKAGSFDLVEFNRILAPLLNEKI